MYGFWDIVCNKWMDGQTDGQKKWHIEVGATPKNNERYLTNNEDKLNASRNKASKFLHFCFYLTDKIVMYVCLKSFHKENTYTRLHTICQKKWSLSFLQ